MFTDKGRKGRREMQVPDGLAGQRFVAARHDARAAAVLADIGMGGMSLGGIEMAGGGSGAATVVLADDSVEAAAGSDAGLGWRVYQEMKFAAEWLAALLMLFVASPLLVALAAAVKLTSPGPAFYAQTRLGRNGRRYRIYKLRTMVHNAEAKTGPVWAALSGDSRITPMGKFLRKTHLDELPQLFNVLKGEMCLIGPRPERPEIAAQIKRRVPDYDLRLAVRPGVTGLAQMLLPADDPSDSGMAGVRRKLACDVLYAYRGGLLMDLKVAVVTPCHFLAEAVRGAGAAGRAISSALHAVRRNLLQSYAVAAGVDGFIQDLERDEEPGAQQAAPDRLTSLATSYGVNQPCESAA